MRWIGIASLLVVGACAGRTGPEVSFETAPVVGEAPSGHWMVAAADDGNTAVFVERGSMRRFARMPWVESTTVRALAVWGTGADRAWVLAREQEWCECSEPPVKVALYRLDGSRWSRRELPMP